MELRVGLQKYLETEIPYLRDFNNVNLICSICQDILHVPKQCETCKQLFCAECVQQQIKNSNKCPFRCLNGQKWKTKEIKFTTKNIQKSPILTALSKIQVQCKEPYCKKKFKLLKYKEHYEKNCDEVFTYCQYLGCSYITRKKYIQQHEKQCQMKQTQFSYKLLKPLNDETQLDELLNKMSKFNEEKNYQQALKEYQEFGLRMQKTYGKFFPTLTTLLYQIGVIYFNQNEFSQALNNLLKFEEYVENKVELKQVQEIQDHYSDVLFTIGYLYEELSQYSKAAKYYERSLKQDISLNLNEDMSVLINLGHSYRLIGDYKKSRDYCIWAIKLYQNQQNTNPNNQENNEQNENQEDLWKVYHNLTYSQYKYGDLKDAEESYLKLQEISKKIHGEKNNQYWETQILYSQILQENDKNDEAIKLITETIKNRQNLLENGHNDIVYTQRKYIQFLTKQDQQKEKLNKEIKKFINQYKKYENNEKEQWKYLLLQYEQSKVYYSQKLYGKALETAQTHCVKLLNNQYVQCMHFRIYQCLALIYWKNNELMMAQEYFFKANQLIIEQFGENSYKHIKVLSYIALFYISQQKLDLAKEYIQKGIEIQQNLGIEKFYAIYKFKYIDAKTKEGQAQLYDLVKIQEDMEQDNNENKNKEVKDLQKLVDEDIDFLINESKSKSKKPRKQNKKINRKKMTK